MDAVQEAFIDTFQALDRIALARRFYPWFYIILRNRCYKLAAGRKKREMNISDETEIVAPTSSIRPEDTMLLEQVMLEVPIEDRELITLRHLAGLSYEELAQRLKIPHETSLARLSYTLKKYQQN